ncbi:MAG: hypothetical protein AAFQ64_06065 [Pseudomonadota bacterium]
MDSLRQFGRIVAASVLVTHFPGNIAAQPIELSQSQLRQLVAQNQILAADVIAGSAAQSTDTTVMDMRGFLDDGRMTYRVLLQRSDGAIVEVLMNGQSGQLISYLSEHGRAVSEAARHTPNMSARTGSQQTNQVADDPNVQRVNAGSPASSRNAKNNRDNDNNNRGNKAERGNGRS